MIRRRSKLQSRDRESGLVFSWRVPLTSKASLVFAILMVGLISAALAAMVRIRVGGSPISEEKRGSLVLVSVDEGGSWLDALAEESGPYPFRWNPAADPAYAALRGRALREAGGTTIPYRPKPVDLPGELDTSASTKNRNFSVFPPLPRLPEPAVRERSRETNLRARVVRSANGPSLQLPRLPLEAKDAGMVSGRRFLIRYQADGQINEVVPLSSDESPANLPGWLGRGRVLGHGDQSGWMVVESTVEP